MNESEMYHTQFFTLKRMMAMQIPLFYSYVKATFKKCQTRKYSRLGILEGGNS